MQTQEEKKKKDPKTEKHYFAKQAKIGMPKARIFQFISKHLRSAVWEHHYKGNPVTSKFVLAQEAKSKLI